MKKFNLEGAIQLVTAVGVVLTGISEIIKQYNLAIKQLDDKKKNNKLNDYKNGTSDKKL